MKVELANDNESRATGLMYRKKLDKDSGMLFTFDNSDHLSFWGKNTYIPLEVAFITKDKVISSVREIIPLEVRVIRSEIPCLYALEVNHGFFESANVSVGDSVEINGDEVTFVKKENFEQ